MEVITADFNNDGQPDLATADGLSNSVSVRLGNDDGTFQPARPIATGPWPQSVAAGDFNADGKLDLATANYDDFGDHDVGNLLGNGDGTFAAAAAQRVGVKYSVAIATGDLNGDQKLDLVVLSDDFFGSRHLSVLIGDGAGNFASIATYGRHDFGQLLSPVLADFNHDAHADVAVSDWHTGSVKVFLGNGDGTLQAPCDLATGYGTNSVAIDDFNADGELDLAATTFNDGRVKVLLGNGDGTFRAAQPFAAGAQPTSVEAADVSGDGNLDLVVTNAGSDPSYAGALSVLLGQGDGSFDLPITVATGGSYATSVALADFNGDRRLDVAVANLSSDSVSVFTNDGVWPSTDVPSLSISDATVTEGNTGTASATFTLTLSSASAVDVTVHYATADDSAMAGNDYQAKSGTATIVAGQTSTTVTVAIIGDTRKEANETFFMNLSAAVGGLISDGQGVGTILDDDGPPKKMNRHDAALMALNFGRITDATEDDGDFTGDGCVDLADLAYLQTQLDNSALSRVASSSAVIASSERARAIQVAVATRRINTMIFRANTRKSAEAANSDLDREFGVSPLSATMVDRGTLFAALVRRALSR